MDPLPGLVEDLRKLMQRRTLGALTASLPMPWSRAVANAPFGLPRDRLLRMAAEHVARTPPPPKK